MNIIGTPIAMVWVLAVLIGVFPLAPSSAAQESGGPLRKLTMQEAKALVRAYSKDTGQDKASGFGFLDEGYRNATYPGFYVLVTVWNNPEPGDAIVGQFAVDDRTGDLWFENACDEDHSPGLERLKHILRRQAGLSEAAYRRLRRQGPYCEGDAVARFEYHRRISVADMGTIVRSYSEETGATAVPGFAVWDEGDDGRYPGFRDIDAVRDKRGTGEQVIASFRVDENTGDLWDAGTCSAVDSPKLEQFKLATRRRLGMSEVEYLGLRLKSPRC